MILDKIFPWQKPKAIEIAIINFIASKLPPKRSDLLFKQFAVYARFHRLDKSREVLMYQKKDLPFPTELIFDNVPSDEYLLATLILKDKQSGHCTTCKVYIVHGRLFSFDFSLPPGDIDSKNMEITGEVFNW